MPSSIRKRRRSSSQNDDGIRSIENEPSLTCVPHNPFRCLFRTNATSSLINDGDDSTGGDDTFEMVVDFLSLTRRTTSAVVQRSSSGVKTTQDIPDMAQMLLDKLVQDRNIPATSTPRLIFAGDIANLLLPWAIKLLWRTPTEPSLRELLWKTLDQCTALSLEYRQKGWSSAITQELASHLSLSNLHKLVPLAWTVASNDDASEGDGLVTKELAASCYRSWVEHFYRPSFDTICQSLVPLIGDAARRRLKRDTLVDFGGDFYDEMSTVTLLLLLTTLKKANPKKAFTTLIQPHIMSTLSDIYAAPAKDLDVKQSMVRQLIDYGLFHLEHHIDGFRSIQLKIPSLDDLMHNTGGKMLDLKEEQTSPAKKSFQCYQQGLMTMVQNVFADASTDQCQVISIARMVPLLFESFIQASNCINQLKGKAEESAGKKKVTAHKVGQLQMAFFANVTEPVLRFTCKTRPRGGAVTALCDSLYQCLNLLLECDIYLPSSDDEGFMFFGFLKGLSHVIIRFTADSSCFDLAIKSLPVLTTALQLNHLVFHENLSSTLASCLTAVGSLDNNTPAEAVPFLCHMIITYKRLRQLDYLCAAIRTAAANLSTQKRSRALQSFCALFENEEVLHEFSDAVQNSPIHQIKQIISEYSFWIHSDASIAGMNSPHGAMPIVLKVFCLLLKSSRVDASSAQELSLLCHDIGTTAVKALIPESTSLKSLDEKSRQGLLLSAWTLDMSNRCDFWLRNSSDTDKDDGFDLPSSVLFILSEGVEQVSKNSKINLHGALKEILPLACHRLQQLHGRIHEKQRISFATDADEFNIGVDIQETKETANFALRALRLESVDGPNFDRLWDSVAATVGSWAPYVDHETMRWFLFRLCARVDPDNESDNDSAMWLLRDASFLETPNVLENFGPSILSNVALSLQEVLDDGSTRESFWGELASSPVSPSWASLKPCDLNQILKSNEEPAVVNGDKLSHLPKVLRSLKLLNSLKAATWHSTSHYSNWLETCVRIDHICGALVKQESSENQAVLIELMSETRMTMSSLLSDNTPSGSDRDLHTVALSNLFRSTFDLFQKLTVDLSNCQRLIYSTKGAISSLIRSARDPSEYEIVVAEYFDRKGAMPNRSELFLLTTFGCAVVTVLQSTEEEQPTVQRICDFLWEYVTKMIVQTADTSAHERRTCIIFVSEILRRGSHDIRSFASIDRLIVDVVHSLDNKDEDTSQYLAYLLGCYAAAEPSRESRLVLFDSLTGFSRILPEIIQDSLSQLAVAMSPEELSECLGKLTDSDNSNRKSSSHLRLYRLIMLNARSEEHFKAIARSSRLVFALALRAMTSVEKRSDTIGEGVSLIQVIAGNRTIMSIRERELCLILSYTVGALQLPSDDQAISVSKTIFDSCFVIVSFLLQRFSKQLHNCIPSVVSCLGVILGRCLYDELSDLEIIDRGHKFSRLTELLLPYGDVYKKHVLSLVVEFVQALKRDMNSIRRSSLSTAIFCLLDILQQHETNQLNSMLDDMGRALLRTVHESYKKQHVYKGQ